MSKAHSCLIFIFLKKIQTIIKKYPKHCPIIILGDFIDNIPKDNNNAKKGLIFRGKFKLKSKFRSQINHMWANVFINKCKYGVI